MSLIVVRNDITKMETEAIVNTANPEVYVGTGCDTAVYMAAGYEQLLHYRREHIGNVEAGNAFITPGFNLKAKYIIHAVSPKFIDGNSGEEELLHSCYRKSLDIAAAFKVRSIAFPLISTGSLGYPKDEGMRIAVDDINDFLEGHDMEIYLVVFDKDSTALGRQKFSGLDEYISENYVNKIAYAEVGYPLAEEEKYSSAFDFREVDTEALESSAALDPSDEDYDEKQEKIENDVAERLSHKDDSFSEYLMYLIGRKHMKNADVYNHSAVSKKTFSKIKNDTEYHPDKKTALCLCIGAHLNVDEARDLLRRAGYALSPSDKTDIIFSYFIENEIYDIVELDILLGDNGLPCLIQ